ncbi:CDP-alcohol phosphatidyltransferase family protein [Tautonia plasticadhaerens]|uniref:Phosphatidylcholine synthase n=1 Tax=Tautonia plasticadhaerens TaxID=2527974 RepID=A0A518H4X5_9BACT|nr:CDP-alcohol phosphatidyltransferase family protein [Tautonia plasticadhaerens]QDV35881.1 Phosphatidylcholine synthase [Tautonia plasticadhaerens]
MSTPGSGGEGLIRRGLAWGVHLYTAMGLVIASAVAVLLVQGGGEAFRGAFLLMVIATLVDATDGTMARKIGVKRVLPGFDGRKLDDLTDYLTYTFLPLLLIWRAELLPPGQEGWLVLALLASAYGFCQVEAKTDDGYFLGFPSLWNAVAFYLYVLQLPGWAALGFVILFSLMTFVPSRYLYPSQPGTINKLSNVLAVPWSILLIWILWRLPTETTPTADDPAYPLAVASLFYPVYYMGASWIITVRRWLQGDPPHREAPAASA